MLLGKRPSGGAGLREGEQAGSGGYRKRTEDVGGALKIGLLRAGKTAHRIKAVPA